MSLATHEFEQVWTWAWIKAHPVRFSGIILHLVLRTLYAIFWLAAGINKVVKDWLTSDILKQIFLDRLTEMPPDAFASLFLQNFAIPLYILVAWVITIGEIYSAIACWSDSRPASPRELPCSSRSGWRSAATMMHR